MEIYNSFSQISDLLPEKLSDSSVFDQIENIVLNLEAEGVPDRAKNELIYLSNLLSKSKNEELIKKYYFIICALRLIALSKTTDEEKKRFLSENIVGVLNQPYANPQHWIKLIFVMYGFDSNITSVFRRLLVEGLDSSLNLIGQNEITVNGEKAKPFVKHWLRDYNFQPAPKIEKGVLDETTYINQSSNTRNLNPEDRELLRKLLRIYDWIRFEVLKERLNTFAPVRERPRAKLPVVLGTTIRKTPLAPQPPKNEHGPSLEWLKHRLEENQVAAIASNPINEEIKREVATPELPEHRENSEKRVESRGQLTPPAPKIVPVIKPPHKEGTAQPHMTTELPSVQHRPTALGVLDDLKNLTPEYLRAGSLPAQTANLKSAILKLAQANHVLPYYAVAAFQESPLFKAYLAHGGAMVGGGVSSKDLSQEEFEALADLRKELERI